MKDSIDQGDVQRPVDAADVSHRLDPVGGNSSDANTGNSDQRRRKKFLKQPNPKDRVQISEDARNALKQEKDS